MLFDDSQGHVNLLISLNLMVCFVECLGKLVEGTIKVVIHKVVNPI